MVIFGHSGYRRGMDTAVVPIVYAAELAALLEEEEGIPAHEVLRGTGITQRRLRDPEELITHRQQFRVYQNAVSLEPRPGFGLRLGARFKPGHHGVLGHALLCARDMRDELRIVVDYAEIRGFLLEFDFREQAGIAVLSAHERFPLGDVHPLVVEELLGIMTGSASAPTLFEGPREIRLDYAAPAHRQQYARLFDCPIHFDTGVVEICFESRALDLPAETSNAEMARICEERCEAILERLGSGGLMVDRVRSHVVAGPRGFQLEEVARRMALTPRTLRRRLREEGTTFREVIADVRKSLALDYLETSDVPLEQIAGLLGYEDASNFNRAFRRWVGDSPGRHRARARGGPPFENSR